MNTRSLLVASCLYFVFAFIVYGHILEKIFGVDKSRKCPSERLSDGVDYVKTHPCVLFGHHFASIAGAGPIVGPVLAAKYGWIPAIAWILLGCVFIGAMHDFAAMFLSIRNDGRSIAYIVEKELGYYGRQMFLIFCLVLLVLVVAVFTDQVATAFINTPSVASSSILFIFMAPVMGCLLKEKHLSLLEASLVFVPLTFLMIWFGTLIPCDLSAMLGIGPKGAKTIWYLVLLYYAFIASTIPVGILLQPRDYLNSFLLYGMMILAIAGIVVANAPIKLPAISIPEGGGFMPDILPMLFVTIACGACSGFHAIVASGTSSKQLANEKDIKTVGYGAMLLEGVLAVIAICAVAYLSGDNFKALMSSTGGAAPTMFAMGVGHFVTALGIPATVGTTFISLVISAFILTSLDTGTRLARCLWQELILPQESDNNSAANAEPSAFRKVLSNRWTSTISIVVLSFILLQSGESTKIWPIFGSANQLLAAMTLLTVTLYLLRNKCRWLFAMLPMLFMFVISVFALINLVKVNLGKNHLQVALGVILLAMAAILAALAAKKIFSKKN
ncbi:MAG: carbon starvation protein A [Lentisphaeria bacterium]|nr:carbon starvation protein A [Lentisphaeria bacterium]